MDSSLVPVEVVGIHTVGPEDFVCVLLALPEDEKAMPVWVDPLESALIAESMSAADRRRPGTYALLAEALTEIAGGVDSIALTSYVEGVFIATITTSDGTELDARASDAIAVAALLDDTLYATEDVVAQAAVHIPNDELKEYVGFSFGDDSDDPLNEKDVQDMLRELGVEDDDNSDSD